MKLTLYFAVSAEDEIFGPYKSVDDTKQALSSLHDMDEISSLEGMSIFEGNEILKTDYCLSWVKPK